MAFLYRAFAVCVLYSVLGQWLNVGAASPSIISPKMSSPGVSTSPSNGSASHKMMTSTPAGASSRKSTVAPHSTVMPSRSITVVPSSKTVVPSSKTVVPSSKTVVPSSKTVVPSHKTVTPSHMTLIPSHNITVKPHSKTVTPFHTTIMPHNGTVTPSHNMTIMPSSAHTVMPSSSVHPTPGPKAGNFSVKKNGTACLLAHMAAKFDIMIVSKKLSVDLPTDASVTGECDESSKVPYIALDWQTKEGHCNFTMHFAIVKDRWAAANLTFSLTMTSGVTESAIYTFHSGIEALNQLSAEVGHAYECTTTSTDFHLTANHSEVNVTLTKIEFQPFEVHEGHPGKVEVCTPPEKPTTPVAPTTPTKKSESHVVPIAVGCSLAGLVLIVGIGYMIGRRRRNSQAGYRKL